MTDEVRQRVHTTTGPSVSAELFELLAHEVRNALQETGAGLKLLRAYLTDGPEEQEILDEVAESQARLEEMTVALEALAQPAAIDARTCLLAARWRRAAVRTEVEITLREEGPLETTVRADPALLEIAFSNLFLEYADAGSRQVLVRVEAASTDGHPPLARVTLDADDPPSAHDHAGSSKASLRLTTARRAIEAQAGRLTGTLPRLVVDLPTS